MKTNQFFKVITAVAILLMLNQFSASGQWLTGLTTTNFSNPNQFGTSLASASGYKDVVFYANGNPYMDLQYSTGNFGIGSGFNNPQYILDMQGNYIGDGVNISCPTCSTVDAVGYSIGGTNATPQMFLWHSGDYSSVYCGINSGFSTLSASAGNYWNTFMGYQAGEAFNGTSGITGNVAFGGQALYHNTGDNNLALGTYSGLANTTGFSNIDIGYQTASNYSYPILGSYNIAMGYNANAGIGTVGQNQYNIAMGYYTGININNGTDNIGIGYEAFWSNVAPFNNGVDNIAIGNSTMWGITTGYENIAIGTLSQNNTSDGYDNIGIGAGALANNTHGYNNVAVGANALAQNLSASSLTAVGFNALEYNTTGTQNTALGFAALPINVGGSQNTATGFNAMFANVSGSYNTANGFEALYTGSANNDNTATGCYALYYNSAATDNTATGYEAIGGNFNLITGSYNTATGSQTMHGLSSGQYNTADGYQSLDANTTGSYNSAFGYGADVTGYPSLSYATAFGSGAIVTTSNTMLLGNNSTSVGIGMSNFAGTGPSNKLEISYASNSSNSESCATPISSTFNGTPCQNSPTGNSGLQFRDLTTYSDPYPFNPTNGFLTVDDIGNVVYMSPPATTGVGYCNSLTPLVNSGGYELSGYDFNFDGNASGDSTSNIVIIGENSCGTFIPNGKLDVEQNSGRTQGMSTGIYVQNNDASISDGPAIGMRSVINNFPVGNCTSSVYPSVAGWFESPFPATGSNFSYSIFVPQPNYSVLGCTNATPGIVSIGYPFGYLPTGPFHLLGSTGENLVYVAGDVVADGYNYVSDRRFKMDFNPLTNAMRKIDSLKPCYYYFDTVHHPQCRFPSGKQVGFVAQNVDSVLPEVVSPSDSGYSMDYAKLTTLIVAGMQQQQGIITRDSLKNESQQSTIDSLRTQLNSIQSCLNQLCNDEGHKSLHHNSGNADDSAESFTNTQDISLSATNEPLLYQNTPNPFSSGTKINYYLPEGTQGATMLFYDSYGNQLKVVPLPQTGNGTLNVTSDNLSAGIYSYSLVVNGKVIDTKRMILQK